MTLEDVPAGTTVLVDANILVYHFAGTSSACQAFLQRCESRQVRAVTGVHLVLEVTHRLMLLEALQRGLITGGQPARTLKERPEIVQRLQTYNASVRQIPRLHIRVRALTPAVVRASAAIRVETGLLTNDSVTVALMRHLGVTAIATADGDFHRVAGLQVYQPDDLA